VAPTIPPEPDPAELPSAQQQQQQPTTLEYYAVDDPARKRARTLTLWSVLLLVGWAPYVCGLVNASTLAIAYNPAIIRAHTGGAVIFMAAGVLISAVCVAGFGRARHLVGIIAAIAVLLVQVSMMLCLGLLR
jgi:hypothetical protein